MMQTPAPLATDLVLVGGGHTHAITLRQLAMVDLPGVQLTLITDLVDTPYSGMLPCHVAGRYDFDEAHIDLRPLTRYARCRLLMDRVVGLDLERQQVLCAHHPPVAYDVLSIDTGSTPATVSVPGAAEYAIPAKPVPQLLRQWQRLLDSVRADPQRPLTLAVVGGGVGGVELTLNLQERLHQLLQELGRSPEQLTLHVFHRGAQLAPGRNGWTRRRLEQIFRQRGIQLHLQEAVTAIEPAADGAYFVRSQGRVVKCDRIFWVTSAAAPAWPAAAGLSTDVDGFIAVGDTLQSCSHANVFAVGDVATMVNHPRPKAGVFAVRQGKPLCDNLLRYLQDQPLADFHPQQQFLNIIDIGYGRAIASRGLLAFESRLARWWKHRIDSKFMALFTDFPAMDSQPRPIQTAAPEPVRPCAGCGAKVGSDVLSRALGRVLAEHPVPDRPDVLIGLEAPDDAAVVRVPGNRHMVHTVDAFRALIDDPFVFAQIALQHSLSDLYAMGAEPQSVLATVTLPYAQPPQQEELLYQLLSGVQKVLTPEVSLVGGHTTTGPELALGFACNGLVDPAQLLRKGGLQPGQKLVLTQPLGTGVLFAADMACRAKGRWIEAAVAAMVQSNRGAARCLRQHGATACTDVTGFGLAGHLLEMVRASGVGARVDLAQLPVFAGVHPLQAAGVRSSLYEQNAAAMAAIAAPQQAAAHPNFPLLFDPQTSGGLLASLPPEQVEPCLQQLHQLGYVHSRCIGSGMPWQDGEQPVTLRW